VCYKVTKSGRLCTMYALVARDGSVLWFPTRQQGTELTLERAKEVAAKLGVSYIKEQI
jgi:hypothetical protein